jgi:hypothetical protein
MIPTLRYHPTVPTKILSHIHLSILSRICGARWVVYAVSSDDTATLDTAHERIWLSSPTAMIKQACRACAVVPPAGTHTTSCSPVAPCWSACMRAICTDRVMPSMLRTPSQHSCPTGRSSGKVPLLRVPSALGHAERSLVWFVVLHWRRHVCHFLPQACFLAAFARKRRPNERTILLMMGARATIHGLIPIRSPSYHLVAGSRTSSSEKPWSDERGMGKDGGALQVAPMRSTYFSHRMAESHNRCTTGGKGRRIHVEGKTRPACIR